MGFRAVPGHHLATGVIWCFYVGNIIGFDFLDCKALQIHSQCSHSVV